MEIKTQDQELIGTIYRIVNKINGKVYHGQTIQSNVKKYILDHKGNANRGDTRYFYNAIRKYGWDNFEVLYLHYKCVHLDDIDELERYYIAQSRSNDKRFGYNLTDGGAKGKLNIESRLKISAAANEKVKRGEFHGQDPIVNAKKSASMKEMADKRLLWNQRPENAEKIAIAAEKCSITVKEQVEKGEAVAQRPEVRAKNSAAQQKRAREGKQTYHDPESRAKRGYTLTEDDIRSIRSDYERGITQADLVRKYNSSIATIHNIVRRKTWKHVK